MTWYWGDIVVKACSTYYGRLIGRCLSMSPASEEMSQGTHRHTAMRGFAPRPGRFKEMSRYKNLSQTGRPLEVSAA